MNVVDSSGWLEYFADGPNAGFFAPAIEDPARLLVPTISLFEVFKKMRLERGEEAALEAVAQMQRGKVLVLEPALAIAAAEASLIHKLPMADAIMLTTARAHAATLWTQDEDFEGFKDVKYVARKKGVK
ncbi:MAG: type II toxin-antitoxin system VapC family toxin [Verrucomicrobiae bacterium]|nr:type II toxin-antitoxin system VapC family toxin [Verrucomicrobiae bacterium]MDW8308046.1 type II toxin-antitoxin system VapC family toxin [Verrucomicrobiales bacterium]